jgi:hypothetical protein
MGIGMPTIGGAKTHTRGAMPATVAFITRRHNDTTIPLRNTDQTREREHYGETFRPGVVATDLDPEHGGTDANQRDGARRLNVDDVQL